jgi:hypothetical protein
MEEPVGFFRLIKRGTVCACWKAFLSGVCVSVIDRGLAASVSIRAPAKR